MNRNDTNYAKKINKILILLYSQLKYQVFFDICV